MSTMTHYEVVNAIRTSHEAHSNGLVLTVKQNGKFVRFLERFNVTESKALFDTFSQEDDGEWGNILIQSDCRFDADDINWMNEKRKLVIIKLKNSIFVDIVFVFI